MTEWQTIETAPMDGTRFIAYGHYYYDGDKSRTEYVEVAAFSGDPDWPWEDAEGLHRGGFYSHWMHLPQPLESQP